MAFKETCPEWEQYRAMKKKSGNLKKYYSPSEETMRKYDRLLEKLGSSDLLEEFVQMMSDDLFKMYVDEIYTSHFDDEE